MEIILCNCDWGLGVELPWHSHVRLAHIAPRPCDRPQSRWIPSLWTEMNPGFYEVLEIVDEITFDVDWKWLYRNE